MYVHAFPPKCALCVLHGRQVYHPMRFFLICMYVGGRLSDEEGAWARSDSAWKGSIEKLYELVSNEFETSSSRLRRPAGWR